MKRPKSGLQLRVHKSGAECCLHRSPGLLWNGTEPEEQHFRGIGATVASKPDDFVYPTIESNLSQYSAGMSLRCLFRSHRPMLTSIVRREGRYKALCDNCGLPIERFETGRWAATMPLVARRVHQAPASDSSI